jgi:proteasome lid subunit RPN8/RPN11
MIQIDKSVTEQMFKHAHQSYPEECCGFLFGMEDKKGNREISEIMVVDNIKDENRNKRFEIDPLDYMRAEKRADELNLNLLSIYHTHPNHPAKPSEHDRVQAIPYFSYIIISVSENRIENTTSWQLNEQEEFDEEKIELRQFLLNI